MRRNATVILIAASIMSASVSAGGAIPPTQDSGSSRILADVSRDLWDLAVAATRLVLLCDPYSRPLASEDRGQLTSWRDRESNSLPPAAEEMEPQVDPWG